MIPIPSSLNDLKKEGNIRNPTVIANEQTPSVTMRIPFMIETKKETRQSSTRECIIAYQ
jgi:hypothetical protein